MPTPPDTDYNIDDVLNTYRIDGSMNRMKARALHEQWLEKIYPRLIDPMTPTSTLVDIAKHLAEVGDLRPKASSQPAQQGPGFSISIVIPQSDGKEPIVIDAKPTEVEPEDDENEPVEALEHLSEGVMPIPVPDFDLSSVEDFDDLLEEDDYDG